MAGASNSELLERGSSLALRITLISLRMAVEERAVRSCSEIMQSTVALFPQEVDRSLKHKLDDERNVWITRRRRDPSEAVHEEKRRRETISSQEVTPNRTTETATKEQVLSRLSISRPKNTIRRNREAPPPHAISSMEPIPSSNS